jgi:hypothetical protein
MGGCCLEGCHIFDADTELEGGIKEEKRLEEGDRGGHGSKTGPFREYCEAVKIEWHCMNWDQDFNYESVDICNEVVIEYCSSILCE